MYFYNCNSQQEQYEMEELAATRFDTIEEEEDYYRDVILERQEWEDFEDSHLDDMDNISELDF